MNEGDVVSEVTQADRERATTPADWKTAVGVRPHYAPCDFPDNPCSCGAAEDRYAIAAALAEERTRAYNRGAIDGMKLAREHREVTE